MISIVRRGVKHRLPQSLAAFCALGMRRVWFRSRECPPNATVVKLRRGPACRGRCRRSRQCTRRFSAGLANGPATASTASWAGEPRPGILDDDFGVVLHDGRCFSQGDSSKLPIAASLARPAAAFAFWRQSKRSSSPPHPIRLDDHLLYRPFAASMRRLNGVLAGCFGTAGRVVFVERDYERLEMHHHERTRCEALRSWRPGDGGFGDRGWRSL